MNLNGVDYSGNTSAVVGALSSVIQNAGNLSVSASQFNNNTINETSAAYTGGIIRNTGTVSQIIGSEFNNNTVTSDGSATSLWGGIINNGITGGSAYGGFPNAEIALIKDTNFIGNTAHSYKASPHGGVLVNHAHIGTIDNVTFEDNTMYSEPNKFGGAHGVALDNNTYGVIDKITNSTFKNNRVYRTGEETTTGNYHASGGALDNYNYIKEISNTSFEGNSAESVASTVNGGAILNIYSSDEYGLGRIDEITNVVFTNNHVYSQNMSAGGGAISTGSGVATGIGAYIGSISGEFTGNYAQTSGRASGGAINNNSYAQIAGGITGNFTENYAKSTGTSATSQTTTQNHQVQVQSVVLWLICTVLQNKELSTL